MVPLLLPEQFEHVQQHPWVHIHQRTGTADGPVRAELVPFVFPDPYVDEFAELAASLRCPAYGVSVGLDGQIAAGSLVDGAMLVYGEGFLGAGAFHKSSSPGPGRRR